jgi:antitoxin MazE
MSEALLDIKYWGNSLGLRLPSKVARAAHLKAEQQVRMYVKDGCVIIQPVLTPTLSLAERLSRFDPQQHGGEALPTSQNLGAEQW